MLNRKETWYTDLFDYMRSVWHTPFEWGVFDCFIFTGQVVKVITGDDYVDQVIGKYSNYDEAVELAKGFGFASPMAFILDKFTPNPSILHAQPGDLMVIRGEGQDLTLGICQGERIYMSGDTGIATVALENAKRSFRV